MRKLFTALLLSATLLLSAVSARPYTLQFTETSLRVRWPGQVITVALSPSLSVPQSNIKQGSDVLRAARRALAHWSEAAGVEFRFIQTSDLSISPAASGGNGISLITIAHTPENAAPFSGPSGETAGRTRLFYDPLSGLITEADIVLNPYQQFSTDGTFGTYDLEATLTHEVGHLLGLEHSAVVGAVMQPRQGRNGLFDLPAQTGRALSEDDRAGVRALYVGRAAAREFGSISGTITYASGAPAFGANVWAEDAETGMVVAGNITLSNGAYRIAGLPPSNYRVMVESLNGPIYAGEIASQRGVYASLITQQPAPFRAEDVGEASVTAGANSTLNAHLTAELPALNAALIGINEQLSTVAVPLSAGHLYTIYVGGDGLSVNQIYSISATSPFFIVNAASIAQQPFGLGLSVISFDIFVRPNAQPGDYSLRLQSASGEISYLAGALKIESSARAAQSAADSLLSNAAADIEEQSLNLSSMLALTRRPLSNMTATDGGAQADDLSIFSYELKDR